MKLYDKQVLIFGSQLGTHGTTQYVRCLWGFDDLPKTWKKSSKHDTNILCYNFRDLIIAIRKRVFLVKIKRVIKNLNLKVFSLCVWCSLLSGI